MKKKYALVCTPGNTIDQGLRMKYMGDVDVPLAKEQHANNCRALESFGYELIVAPPEDRFPDSTFVEDPLIIIKDVLVVARLRDPKRQGEEERLLQFLAPYFDPAKTFRIEPPGFVEGGDVLITSDHVYVGVSARTNEAGVGQLARIARDACGFKAEMVPVPHDFLHLKGESTFHPGKNLITASEEIAHLFANSHCTICETSATELYGGNNISEGDRMIMHTNCPESRRRIEARGFYVRELDLSEYAKINGARTCLSKLFFA